ncbi:beta-glucuronidase [Enterococcus florum]|uniref:Beta-glucuronidase n=1 Tax=Enterococcus florum TaxID=2480627 RepID=A0A4P5P9P2_9ENTE|nr:glycoside hydrolase family 2 TIM barrel-domain containing protein [Enterococcus florum]GCF94640.1 beta-glucuronidase [Enterococcus florum]
MDFYPRPQFEREKWLDLDGIWSFDFDDQRIGIEKKWYEAHEYSKEIKVPFVYQSGESGINSQETHDCVWYNKVITLADVEAPRILLHFGASDYYTKVWVNNQYCGDHQGGHTPFSFDISHQLAADGQVKIDVCVTDRSTDEELPRGKQNFKGKSEGIFYTGTTGIWQSVWLEFTEKEYIDSVHYKTDTITNKVTIAAKIQADDGAKLGIKIARENEVLVENVATIKNNCLNIDFEIPDFNDHHYGFWWSPEQPNLYDVEFTLLVEDRVVDRVGSYFGMRTISIEHQLICLNHMPFYTKSVLYQGYYPNSLMTAKSDEELRRDVELIKEMGFNSVRLHQKYENPRFLYWCDKLGLMVWGEAPNAYSFSPVSAEGLLQEWLQVVNRDINHPSICIWVPLNESWGIPKIKNSLEQQSFANTMYYLTKALDSTRLVLSNDGWEHTISDICTIHDYDADLERLADRYDSLESILAGPQERRIYVDGYEYQQEPMILSEFGGIAFEEAGIGEEAWGYSGASSSQEFEEKVLAILSTVQASELLQGYCYTQFNDLEQEVNGLLTMEREPKLNIASLARVNQSR